MYAVDTLIGNLESAAQNKSSAAGSYVAQAKAEASGTPPQINPAVIQYVTSPSGGPSGSGAGTAGTSYLTGAAKTALTDALTSYYNTYFPNVEDDYNEWMAEIERLILNGTEVVPDNAAANQQAQIMDEMVGKRAQRLIRSSVAGRGYSLPPGILVGAVIDNTDERTEKLISGAISNASKATGSLVDTYKAVIAAASQTAANRVAALNAVSGIIKTMSGLYSARIDEQVADMDKYTAEKQILLEYFNAEAKLDALNLSLYKQASMATSSYVEKLSRVTTKSGISKAEAALASAINAGKVAQAAYSSLTTVVSASTAGFE